jgi:hypothetical protein
MKLSPPSLSCTSCGFSGRGCQGAVVAQQGRCYIPEKELIGFVLYLLTVSNKCNYQIIFWGDLIFVSLSTSLQHSYNQAGQAF